MKIIGLPCFLLFFLECIAAGSVEIVGGDPIEIEKVPYFAIYRMKDDDYGCGGSIVTDQFIISAAHCHYAIGCKDAEVVVGTDRIKQGEHHDILAGYPHPRYTHSSSDYDVVILKLVKKLVLSGKVQPIKLAEPGIVIGDDAVFQTLGFGLTDPDNPLSVSEVLLSVNVPYVNDTKCAKAYGSEFTKRMICAGEEGKDSCQADSGGPLVYEQKLVGLVSFGHSCAVKGWPGVYARVSALRDFIDEAITKHASL